MTEKKSIGVSRSLRERLPWHGTTDYWMLGVFIGVTTTVFTAVVSPKESYTGIAVGLLFLLLSMAIDLRQTIKRASEVSDRRARLMAAMERCALPEEELVSLCEAAAKIDDIDEAAPGRSTLTMDDSETKIVEFLHEQAIQGIRECRDFLDAVARGELNRERADHSLLLRCTEREMRSIRATSTAVDRNFWESAAGLMYFHALVDAKQRNISVRRIFIVTEEKLTEMAEVIDRQVEAGLEVKWLSSVDVAPEQNVDFILFDMAGSYEVQANPEGEIVGTTLFTNPDHVARRADLFESMWKMANEEPAGHRHPRSHLAATADIR